MIEQTIGERLFRFNTADRLFSASHVDLGTLFLIRCLEIPPEGKLLDLGCGYGPIGLYMAAHAGPERVTMLDIDPSATRYARENAALNELDGIRFISGDGLSALPDAGYALIACHPPYHSDFSVAKSFIEKGFNRLTIGGEMYMVVRRELWYRNKLTAIFGGLKIYEQDGYFVLRAQKRSEKYARKRT